MSTVTLAGYNVDSAVVAKVTAWAAREGMPFNVAMAFPLAESGGNPTALGDSGSSHGLLQEHQGGGQGDGYTVSQLNDADTNLAIGMPIIGAAYRANGNLAGRQRVLRTAAESGHPADPDKMTAGSKDYLIATRGINRIADIWAKLEAERPTASSDASIAGMPTAGLQSVLDGALAYAHAHPLQAAAAGVIAVIALS